MAEADVGQGAGAVADQAKSAVRNLCNRQKTQVADRISGVARILLQTANSLEGRDPAIGRYTAQVAQQVGRLSDTLRDRGVDDLWADTEAFARRQPLLFIGGAMAAGFLLARMIKIGDRGTPGEAVGGLTEETRVGGLAEEARDVALQSAESAAEAGQGVAEDAGEAAVETTQGRGHRVRH